jgi:hypothetical protein
VWPERASHAEIIRSHNNKPRFKGIARLIGPASEGKRQPCCPVPTEIEGLGQYLMSRDGFHERIGGETPVFGVAQMEDFGLRRSKMLYLSMGVD